MSTSHIGIVNVAVSSEALVTVTSFPLASFTVHPSNIYPSHVVAVRVTVSPCLYGPPSGEFAPSPSAVTTHVPLCIVQV